MSYVLKYYRPVTASDVVAAIRGETVLPAGAILITFDDGYRDFLIHAWPILRRQRIPAVLFVATGFHENQSAFWWDELYEMVHRTARHEIRLPPLEAFILRTPDQRRRAVNRLRKHLLRMGSSIPVHLKELRSSLGQLASTQLPILTWDELRDLARDGLAIASHGATHAALPLLTDEEIAHEVMASHKELLRKLGAVTPLFAYPHGLADSRAVSALRASGYVAAFTATPGINRLPRDNHFALARRSVNIQYSHARFALGLTSLFVKAGQYKRRIIHPRA